jgi:ribosome-associated heat shock protein Hsp15
MVNDVPAKPSKMVKIGDIVQVRKPPVTYSFKVLGVTSNRIGAKLIPQYFENITPPEQYELLELQKISGFIDRARGTGRPTKKERRDLDNFNCSDYPEDEFDFDE